MSSPERERPSGVTLLLILLYMVLAVAVALVEQAQISPEVKPIPASKVPPDPPGGTIEQIILLEGTGWSLGPDLRVRSP